MFNFLKRKFKKYPTPKFKCGDRVSWWDAGCGISRDGVIIDYSVDENDIKYVFLDKNNNSIYEWIDEVELCKRN